MNPATVLFGILLYTAQWAISYAQKQVLEVLNASQGVRDVFGFSAPTGRVEVISGKRSTSSIRRIFNEGRASLELNYSKSHGGLNDHDRRLLQDIYYKSESVIEWGVGESTLIAQYTGVQRYVGVDSARDWIAKVSTTAPSNYKFMWVNIGPILAWGKPKDPGWKNNWPQYSIAPLASEPEAFDFYFIDGRFRVASVCAAFLHAGLSNRNHTSFRVGMHDFQERHEAQSYGAVLSIADVVDGYDPERHDESRMFRIVIMRRKPTATTKQILDIWTKYALVWN
jgi:hypothetical protein